MRALVGPVASSVFLPPKKPRFLRTIGTAVALIAAKGVSRVYGSRVYIVEVNDDRPRQTLAHDVRVTRRPLFCPTARQTNWLLVIGLLSVGEALYLRYMAIENSTVSIACQAGLQTWLCSAFRLAIILFNHQVFGAVALAAALLNLLRPSIVLVALTLAAAGFGVVLHNADLSALAAGLLILSLARPAPVPE